MSQSIVMPLQEPALLELDGDRIRAANVRTATIFGVGPDGLVGAPAGKWIAGVEHDGGAVALPRETVGRRRDGTHFRCRMHRQGDGKWLLQYLPEASEILDLFQGQRRIVDRIVRGDAVHDVLAAIAMLAEQHTPGGMRCSILMLDEKEGVLRTMGQPSLPKEFTAAIDRLVPAYGKASCGHAAATGVQVLTTQIDGDPWWQDFAGFMAQHGIQASWSSPILSPSNGKVFGTFGMYYPAPRHPTPAELYLIETFTHLAALAIDRHHGDVVRREHRAMLDTAHMRDLFFGTVAHDLRSPLQSVMLGLDHLETLRPERTPEEMQALAVVRQAASYLLDVAEDATQLARPSSEVRLDRAPHDLAALARDAAAVVMQQARQRGIRIEVVTDALPPRANVDAARIRRCIVNLLSNAISHSPDGATVRIDVTDDVGAGRATIAVADQGPGLPPGREYLVFEPFVQLAESQHRKGSAGLGLAIVKRFVEAHGGAVGVQSAPGKGARFRVELPSLPPQTQAPRATSPAAPAATPAVGIAGLRILVADDEELLRGTMVRHLGRTGATVVGAKDGQDALEQLRAGAFDVLLLDVNMPRLNGPGVLAALRREPLAQRPLVALLTGGDVCDENGVSYADLGADLVLQKPVRIAALVELIVKARAERGA
jgi:signal transduction histidine kinase